LKKIATLEKLAGEGVSEFGGAALPAAYSLAILIAEQLTGKLKNT
jgi:hypothetical protein